MKSNARKLSLSSYDDIFRTDEERSGAIGEKIVQIPLSQLHPFPNHPFKVRDDEQMTQTVDSIKQYGVLVPAIVRPCKDGGYELVADQAKAWQ